jgi:hypothetical protein
MGHLVDAVVAGGMVVVGLVIPDDCCQIPNLKSIVGHNEFLLV